MQNNMPLRSNCDRYDGDDVDILYVLETHGWSTCILYIGDTTHSIDSISHAFGDPLGDLAIATISLLKGASEVEFTWWHEPGGTQWKIVRSNDEHHNIIVTVIELLSDYGHPITQDTILAEFEIKISHFATLVYYQMKKISVLLKEKSYEKNRSGEFPYADFHKLESFFLE
jgi:hypothetical protein